MPTERQGGEPGREQEKTIVVYIDLMRHANRFAGKNTWTDPVTEEAVSFNDTENLTPEGKANARQFGADLPAVDYVVGVGSMEARAAETAADIEAGAGRQRQLGPNQLTGITYKELGQESAGVIKKVKPMIEAEAAKFLDYGRIPPEERAKARERAQEVGLREAMKDEGITQEMAEGIAYNLYATHAMSQMAREAAPGFSVAMPIVNHGMYNEAFLLQTLKVVNPVSGERRAVRDVDEFGGFFQPGESFRIKNTQSREGETFEYHFTNPARQGLFRDSTLELDWRKVRELAIAFDKRMHKGRSYIEEMETEKS